jgi:hypothetical protein
MPDQNLGVEQLTYCQIIYNLQYSALLLNLITPSINNGTFFYYLPPKNQNKWQKYETETSFTVHLNVWENVKKCPWINFKILSWADFEGRYRYLPWVFFAPALKSHPPPPWERLNDGSKWIFLWLRCLESTLKKLITIQHLCIKCFFNEIFQNKLCSNVMKSNIG